MTSPKKSCLSELHRIFLPAKRYSSGLEHSRIYGIVTVHKSVSGLRFSKQNWLTYHALILWSAKEEFVTVQYVSIFTFFLVQTSQKVAFNQNRFGPELFMLHL